jgi:hypothetical protein
MSQPLGRILPSGSILKVHAATELAASPVEIPFLDPQKIEAHADRLELTIPANPRYFMN